ncbi:hypothetical protein [Qipengyuania nanhaisediminis]|uniref:Uncharacterized protein n=1 Tax=Qipengyuania nanhaisediminis TaxID=604088 RepID=A0A1I5LAP1_9SPHN|nr:hypothetical protein [Qipengyuania nanhaisediminis]SFO94317.1 hypothetical protein SAMN04488060_0871 [Qipengyuania nanhaisediminis]
MSDWRERQAEVNLLREEIQEHQKRLFLFQQEQSASLQEIQDERARRAPKFEYLILEDVSEEELDIRGANGWELVNFASYSVGGGGMGVTAYKVHLRYVFKREMLPLSDELQAIYDEMDNLRREIATKSARVDALVD